MVSNSYARLPAEHAANAPAAAAGSGWRWRTALVAAAVTAGAAVAVVTAVAASGPDAGLPRKWRRMAWRIGGERDARGQDVGGRGDARSPRQRRLPPRGSRPELHTAGIGQAGANRRRGGAVTAPAATAGVPSRFFFPRWVAGSQLNNQLVRLVQLLHAAALTGGVLVLPPKDCPSAVTAWLDVAALVRAVPDGSLTMPAFLTTPAGRSLVAAGAIRPAADGACGGGALAIGPGGAAGTVKVYPDWLVTRSEDDERPPKNGTCAAATAFEYVGVDSLTQPPLGSGRDVAGTAAVVAMPPMPLMGILMSAPWHYCGRRVRGWAGAWRAIRPHPTLAGAAAAYVAAAEPPLVAVHVRDLEDGGVPAVLAVTDGVAKEIHAALLARAAATGVPPRTVHVSHVGEAPARVRNALAARLAAAGGWQAAVVVMGCAQLPGCTLPPSAAASSCTARTCATATPDPAAAERVTEFLASRAPEGSDRDGGGVGGGVGMYEMAVWLAADYFIGVRASSMSVNAAMMRAAGGPGVGGDGLSRVRDMAGFQAFGPFYRGWTQHYWTNSWATTVAKDMRVNGTFPLPGGAVGVLVSEMVNM